MTVRQKIAVSLASAVLTLLVGIAAVMVVRRLRDAIDQVDHTYTVISHLDGLIAALVDAETGERGFIITGDSSYLAPYALGRAAADSHLVAVRRLTADNAVQQRRLDTLAVIAHERTDALEEGIALRKSGGVGSAAVVVASGRGRRIMDRARRLVAVMERDERRLLAERDARRASTRRLALFIIAVGTLGAFLLAFLSNRAIRRDVMEQQRVQEQLEHQAKQMQDQAVELELANEQLHDTTSQAEEAREMAEVASRAKSDFLAVMSHELRTPLNAIVGYAELLHDGVAGPVTPTQREQLERVQLSARHLVELLDDILSFSRVEAGRETIRPSSVDLGDVTREAGALVEPVATAKGLRFAVEAPTERVAFESDAGKVRQVLVNLLSNAIKFTDRGEIVLSSHPEDGRVVFEVRDTGIGIAPEHLARVFEAFWQADQSATRRVGGAGLGLSVSRRLAQALGGDLSVESRVGEGSRFRFWVPRDRRDLGFDGVSVNAGEPFSTE
jgi:signal transduction histidine kinase